MPLTRRDLLAAVPAALAASAALGRAADPKSRPRIAAIVTELSHKTHGQGIVDRFLDGYGWDSQHYRPCGRYRLALRRPEARGDLSREREQRHPGLKVYPTIAEALTCGGDRLAVDGVLLDRRARQLSRGTRRARRSIRATSSSSRSSTVFRRERPLGAGLQR